MAKVCEPDFTSVVSQRVSLPYREEPYQKFSFSDPMLKDYSVIAIEDSLSTEAKRLTTFVARYPRYIHSELLTHRVFSKNASSSRARSVQVTLREVMEDPVIPLFTINRAGMTGEFSPPAVREKQIAGWLLARNKAVASALSLLVGPEVLHHTSDSQVARNYEKILEGYYENHYDKEGGHIGGLSTHKQVTNRLLESFLHMEIVLTSSYWDNFLRLRNHNEAQPEFHALAALLGHALEEHTPARRSIHLPFAKTSSRPKKGAHWQEVYEAALLSSAECAQISYRDKSAQKTATASLDLGKRLLTFGHYSPFEHQAFENEEYHRLAFENLKLEHRPSQLISNFDPAWIQFRSVISGRTL